MRITSVNVGNNNKKNTTFKGITKFIAITDVHQNTGGHARILSKAMEYAQNNLLSYWTTVITIWDLIPKNCNSSYTI